MIWLKRVSLGLVGLVAVTVLYAVAIYGLYARSIPPQWQAAAKASTYAAVRAQLGEPAFAKESVAVWEQHPWWGTRRLQIAFDTGSGDLVTPGSTVVFASESDDLHLLGTDKGLIWRNLRTQTGAPPHRPAPTVSYPFGD